jgi:putative thioredoxin
VTSYGGKVRLVKVNVDEQPAIAGQLRVQSLPTVYAFRDGRPLDGFMGAQPETAIRAFIDRILTDDAEGDLADVLASAEEAQQQGDVQTAAEIFAAVLQQNKMTPALAGLPLLPATGKRAERCAGAAGPKNVAAVEASGGAGLARKAAGGQPRRSRRGKANPATRRADLAVALPRATEGVPLSLLEIVRRDRNWNDQGARKQLVQLFEAWGSKDPATVDGRRRLASLLFS